MTRNRKNEPTIRETSVLRIVETHEHVRSGERSATRLYLPTHFCQNLAALPLHVVEDALVLWWKFADGLPQSLRCTHPRPPRKDEAARRAAALASTGGGGGAAGTRGAESWLGLRAHRRRKIDASSPRYVIPATLFPAWRMMAAFS
jgi:hypothetical protein